MAKLSYPPVKKHLLHPNRQRWDASDNHGAWKKERPAGGAVRGGGGAEERPRHLFYTQLNAVLGGAGFDGFFEALCTARLAYKAEHAVDLETEALVAGTVATAGRDAGPTAGPTGTEPLIPTQASLVQIGSEAAVEELVANKGYHDNRLLAQCAQWRLQNRRRQAELAARAAQR